MQRYRVISDIHCEFWPENFSKAAKMADRLLPPVDDDADTVLLLAGDTGSFRRRNVYRALIERLSSRFHAVIDIPGNHYWYGGTDWAETPVPAIVPNYHFGGTVTLGAVVAATLWADFGGGSSAVEEACLTGMNDFKGHGLDPALVKRRHAEQLDFLREAISPGCVVMTHFAPSLRSIPPGEEADPINGYYASDLEWLIRDRSPALWLHGHIHEPCDYRIGETRVLSNPAGYYGKGHDPRLTIIL